MKSYQKVFRRIEKKYVLTDKQYRKLMEYLFTVARIDKYGKTKIMNIYFDTPDYRLIRTSLEKPVYKEKLRLRTYGKATDDANAFLEIKKKFHGVVYKRRIEMPYKTADAFLKHLDHKQVKEEHSQIGEEIDYFFKCYPNLAPRMVITYDRIALEGIEDPDFRVTFDTNIRYRTSDLDLRKGAAGKDILAPGEHLMELKISGAMPIELSKKLSELGIFSTSFSKYGRGYLDFIRGKKIFAFSGGNPQRAFGLKVAYDK